MYSIDKSKVLFREQDGIVTVLMLEAGDFYELNAVGSMVWKLLAEGLEPDAIIERLATTFDATREQLAIDVHAFIVKMIASGLIEE